MSSTYIVALQDNFVGKEAIAAAAAELLPGKEVKVLAIIHGFVTQLTAEEKTTLEANSKVKYIEADGEVRALN